MAVLRLDVLKEEVRRRVEPFLKDVLKTGGEAVHSIYVTGSAVTDEYDPRRSDINSVVALGSMDFGFIERLAPLGKVHGKRRVAAPLIMTPEYIGSSRDVFPIEFLDIQLIHATVCGPDLFEPLEIRRADLRAQCERELKVKLVALRQGYLSTRGDRRALAEGLVGSISSYMPLFRGIVRLQGMLPPVPRDEVLKALEGSTGVDCAAFSLALRVRQGEAKPSLEELIGMFESYYGAVEGLIRIVDGIQA